VWDHAVLIIMTGKRRIVFVAVLAIAALALSAGMVSAAGDTEVSVEPSDSNVTVNSTQTFEVVVNNASTDVRGYNFTLSVANGSVATITNASAVAQPSDFNANISQDGSSATVDAVWFSSSQVFQSTSPTILTVEVETTAVGQTELNTNLGQNNDPYVGIANESGAEYNVTASNAASITVEEPGAQFEVSNLSAPSTATVGDTVVANATITNTGGASGSDTVEFRLNGTTVNSTTVSLAAGASQQVSLSANTSSLGARTYTHGFFTADSSRTAQITLAQPGSNPTVPGGQGPAQNVDSDPLLEDVDGSGTADVFDAIALYNNRNEAIVQNNPQYFDFDGNNQIDVFDAIELYNKIQAQS